MINRQQLLADLQKFLKRIEADLLERSESTEVPEVPAALHAEYEKAAKAERTAQNYEDWRTDTITQAAAAWVLSCVFVRFLEDNSLIDPPKIAGPGDRLARARDEHELYFRSHPQHTDREYLLSIFGELAKLPGTRDIFGEHNAINDLPNWLSGDAAGELLNFFQKIDASTGDLVHDFTDPSWDTRFLGDLYQDLSEAARKKFALLQTPDFVEEFILDRTLDPALDEFGLVPQLSGTTKQSDTCFRMIDPACGSGHFLLGAFPRLLERWQRKEPGTNIRELTQRTLDSIHGVDINPFAVAIAKFRLLLVAMKSCKIHRLVDAPAFHINIACGDSLLHGENQTSTGQNLMDFADGATDQELYSHAYPGEELSTVRSLLKPNSYHCVVANPPYIVPNDEKLNAWYRRRFSVCFRQYSLAAPFMQQIFGLASSGGYIGQITANSFMKREFGKRLITSFFPRYDLTHVIDTSGAYIPGHGNPDGTPTTIIFAKNRPPLCASVRMLMSLKGEPGRPEVLREGKVWREILQATDLNGFTGEYITSVDTSRDVLKVHPWSLGAGGLSELKQFLVEAAKKSLDEFHVDVGRMTHTGEDDAFYIASHTARTSGTIMDTVPLGIGEDIRDFAYTFGLRAFFPYQLDKGIAKEFEIHASVKHFWSLRAVLKNRVDFGQRIEERGLRWFDHSMFFATRFLSSHKLVYPEIATHPHFVNLHASVLFKHSAGVICFPPDVDTKIVQSIQTILNSSTACLWARETLFPKGGFAAGKWEERLVWNSTNLRSFPIPELNELESLASSIARNQFERLQSTALRLDNVPSGLARKTVDTARIEYCEAFARLVSEHEDHDWVVYRLYGFVDGCADQHTKSPPILPGQRAFEIVLARRMVAGESQSKWFERHGSTPITELPLDWPDEYKKLVERRIELIQNDPNIRLIEQPEYKRRWNSEPWESQLERALCEWLLLRLETYFDFDGRMTDSVVASNRSAPLAEIAMYSIAQLADAARRDAHFMELGELYRDDPAFDVQALVEELVAAESVPHLPILRYKDSGLRKRAEWEKTWDLQRSEDAGESVGTIPVPPKYTSADFISTGGARYWSLRGKLDVPKERWISFPHCEGPDGTVVLCWAGYDHLQQAQAISAYYVRVQTEFGGSDDPRLIPLLASLIELLPWLKQWHNEPNANFDGLRMGDYFEGFVNEEARALGKTLEEIRAWTPPKGQRGRVAKGQSGKRKGQSRKGSKGQSEEGENQ